MGWRSCTPQLSDCTVCMEAMTVENSIQVPCCGQFVHTVCLARSFSSRGVDCPFCNQSLADFARSSSFLASSLFHGCMVDLDRAPSNQAIDSLVFPDDFPPSPPVYPLCCTRWRFSFGIGPTKSAVMVFGPLRGRPDCSVHLGGVSLPLVSLLLPLSLGVLTLTWSALVVIASSTKLAPGVVAKVCLSLSPHLSSFLTSFPVRHLVWSSSATPPQHFSNSTSRSLFCSVSMTTALLVATVVVRTEVASMGTWITACSCASGFWSEQVNIEKGVREHR